jgi:hypothetical protein
MIYLKKLSDWDGFVDFVKSDEYAGDIIAWDGGEGVYYNDAAANENNPELMDIARNEGWVDETATTLSFRTCFGITTEQFNEANVNITDSSAPNGYDSTFKNLTHFDEFQYFLEVTALTFTSIDNGYKGSFFNATKLESLVLPPKVMLTENYTFRSCSSLTNLVLPNGLKQLGRQAFVYCWALKHLELPNTLNVIKESCFVYSGLGDTEPLMLPTSITYLGATSCPIYWYRKFNETLDFPRVRYFGQENFINQVGPRNLIIGDRLETLGVGDHEYTQHYNDVFWDTLESVTISPDCENFKTINNVVYTKDGVYCYGGADYGLSKQEVLELEEGTQKIVSGAFRTFFSYDDSAEACPWCHREDMILRRVIFPSTLVQIGYCCFQYSMPFEVVCKAVTPPKRLYGVFASGVGNIYVPDESVDAYKAAQYWSGNRNKIKPMSELPEI